MRVVRDERAQLTGKRRSRASSCLIPAVVYLASSVYGFGATSKCRTYLAGPLHGSGLSRTALVPPSPQAEGIAGRVDLMTRPRTPLPFRADPPSAPASCRTSLPPGARESCRSGRPSLSRVTHFDSGGEWLYVDRRLATLQSHDRRVTGRRGRKRSDRARGTLAYIERWPPAQAESAARSDLSACTHTWSIRCRRVSRRWPRPRHVEILSDFFSFDRGVLIRIDQQRCWTARTCRRTPAHDHIAMGAFVELNGGSHHLDRTDLSGALVDRDDGQLALALDR